MAKNPAKFVIQLYWNLGFIKEIVFTGC
jgi:hypothetical protein